MAAGNAPTVAKFKFSMVPSRWPISLASRPSVQVIRSRSSGQIKIPNRWRIARVRGTGRKGARETLEARRTSTEMNGWRQRSGGYGWGRQSHVSRVSGIS